MANKNFSQPITRALVYGMASANNGQRTLNLNGNFVFNTSGTAVNYRFVAPTTSTLVSFYVFISAVNGTPGSLTCELRNDNVTNSPTPGSTVLATQTITWDGTANHWNQFTFSSPGSVTLNTTYWIVIYNAASTPTTNFPQIVPASSNSQPEGWGSVGQAAPFRVNSTTSGTGWNTIAFTPVGCWAFGDGTLMGNPYAGNAVVDTSSTKERGIVMSLPFDVALGSLTFNNATQISGFKIYKGTTAPGGSTVASISFPFSGNGGMGWFNPEVILVRNTTYRIVMTQSSAGTGSQYIQIPDQARYADVSNLAFNGGLWGHTIDGGSGAWVDDFTKVPAISLMFNRVLSGGNSFSA